MKNNGGKTDYYKIKKKWKTTNDIIEERKMNFAQGNILKSAITFNLGRHSGTNEERELNKIIYYAKRQLNRVKEKND